MAGGNTTVITADMALVLVKDLADLKARSEKLSQALAANPDVDAAYAYVQTKITAKN